MRRLVVVGELHEFLVAGAKDLRHRAGTHLQADCVDRGEVLRVPEHPGETPRSAPSPVQLVEFREDDCPTNHGGGEKKKKYHLNRCPEGRDYCSEPPWWAQG